MSKTKNEEELLKKSTSILMFDSYKKTVRRGTAVSMSSLMKMKGKQLRDCAPDYEVTPGLLT